MLGVVKNRGLRKRMNFYVNKEEIIQQLSHLSQVFGVGYMNQKRITPIGHTDQLSPLIPIEQYAFTKTFGLYILSYYLHPCFLRSPLRSFNLP